MRQVAVHHLSHSWELKVGRHLSQPSLQPVHQYSQPDTKHSTTTEARAGREWIVAPGKPGERPDLPSRRQQMLGVRAVCGAGLMRERSSSRKEYEVCSSLSLTSRRLPLHTRQILTQG
ncbi:hypothetical protein E2C01_013973 [Portunus trituberculatus]|uniref:Uncharacterized protein n=1 Tax=Portunus trituberculatus TaxID=210409 RepID=A0A5B7DHL7_PORTR|nr:hypothetical protein [Portunus trituberculatus]